MFKSPGLSAFARWLPLLALFPFLITQFEHRNLIPFILFIGLVFSDNGHIFVTAFRIFAKHRPRKEKIKFAVIISCSVFLSVVWLAFQIPYFWSVFIYFTVFHHLKQNLGLFKWLVKSEKMDGRFLGGIAYAGFLLPFIFFHLRSDIQPEHIVSGLLPTPQFLTNSLLTPLVLNYLRGAITLVLLSAAGGCIFKGWKESRNPRVGFYVFSVTALNVFSMMYGKTFLEIYIPLVISHGCTYILVIGDSLVKVQRWSIKRSLVAVVLAALAYGIIDWLMQADTLFEYRTSPLTFWALLGGGLTAGLNMAHYYIDGLIWKKGDPDYALIYDVSLREGH